MWRFLFLGEQQLRYHVSQSSNWFSLNSSIAIPIKTIITSRNFCSAKHRNMFNYKMDAPCPRTTAGSKKVWYNAGEKWEGGCFRDFCCNTWRIHGWGKRCLEKSKGRVESFEALSAKQNSEEEDHGGGWYASGASSMPVLLGRKTLNLLIPSPSAQKIFLTITILWLYRDHLPLKQIMT